MLINISDRLNQKMAELCVRDLASTPANGGGGANAELLTSSSVLTTFGMTGSYPFLWVGVGAGSPPPYPLSAQIV
jgi:hypothetical protein